MPYSTNADLPSAVRDAYAGKCQSVFRSVFNSEFDDHGKESRAFATAHAAAKRCQGSKKTMLPLTTFKLYAPTLVCSRSEDGKLRLEGVASSTIKDHHGDQLTLKALQKMAGSAVGMTIFMNHEYRVPQDVFGKVEKARVVDSGDRDAAGEKIWDLRLGIGVAASNDQAVKTFNLLDSKEANLGISIGAMVPDGGAKFDKVKAAYVVDDCDLVEASIIGIPANPRAWVDYVVKAFSGHFPKQLTPERRKELLGKMDEGDLIEVPDEEPGIVAFVKGAATPNVVHEGVAAQPGDVVELTSDGKGGGSSRILHKAGTPEAAAWMEKNGGEHELEPAPDAPGGDEPGDDPDTDIDTTATGEAADASEDDDAGDTSDEAEIAKTWMGASAHADLLKAAKAPKTHTHGHAHEHDHEHSHGYPGGNNFTVHSHDHAHMHSHEHGADHEHNDTQNDWEHNHSHAGAYGNNEHPHDQTGDSTAEKPIAAAVDPAVKKTVVSVWEDAGTGHIIEVNTGRKAPGSQSAQADGSETAGGSTEGKKPKKKDASAEAMLLATESLGGSRALLTALQAQLTAARTEIGSLTSERNAAIELAKKAMESTQELIARIGEIPMGRKTGFVAVQKDFTDLQAIYNDDVRRLMTAGR